MKDVKPMRGFILAVQFLTRIPTPQLVDFNEDEFSSCAVWFPLVGLLIGLFLVLAAWLGMSASSWMAALLVLLVWAGITGGLHVDGAADLADALGAAHANPERFQTVMKDPHVGVFGVIAVVLILITKLVAVAWLIQSHASALWLILLIPAWSRLASVYWSQTLEPLEAGRGERFAWHVQQSTLWIWAAALFFMTVVMVSWWFACLACLVIYAWRAYLKRRLGGMSGDCLGAGIEYCECAMLLMAGLI